jgi:hypothetical protein
MLSTLTLMCIYKSPIVRLEDVCERYFGLSYEEAVKKAARNELPVPAFRLRKSQKAPWMVSCEDLGLLIDKQRAAAAEIWQRQRPAVMQKRAN